MTRMSLRIKVISGAKWSALSQCGRQVVTFATTAVLAHLLSPSDYGLLGMATIVTGFLSIFRDLGTSAAIIQRKEVSQELFSTVFWINIIFGLFTMVVIAGVSPLVAIFYHEPRLTAILMVLSLSFLISGASVIPQAILQRDLSFKNLSQIELMAAVIAAITGVMTALAGVGVWSLVVQSLAASLTSLLLLWKWCKWRPAWVFRVADIHAIRSFSSNLVGFNIFNYFIRNGDYLLIGKYLGAQELGFYTLAYRLMLFPVQSVSSVLGGVLFPAFSKMQDNERFRAAYLRVTTTIAFAAFPMMFGLWATTAHFVQCFYGDKWSPVVVLIKILAPVGMMQAIGTTVGFIYQAKGRTDWMFKWGVASGVLVLVAFAIGVTRGCVGVATAYLIVCCLLLYPSFAIPFKLINLSFLSFVNTLWRPFLCGVIMYVGILFADHILAQNMRHAFVLVVEVSLGIAIYMGLSWCLNRGQLRDVLGIFIQSPVERQRQSQIVGA